MLACNPLFQIGHLYSDESMVASIVAMIVKV